MLNIDNTDPFFVTRFLQSVYTNYLKHVKQNNSDIVTDILDKSRAEVLKNANSISASFKP
jgi:hypothetical protein